MSTSTPSGHRRLGTYWKRAVFDRARSAYVVDLDALDDPPVGFARWVEAAIMKHVRRTPAQRAAVAIELSTYEVAGAGVQRSLTLSEEVISAAEAAIVADRQAGRLISLSQFITETAYSEALAAEHRYGRPLPDPPARLPTRPSR